MDPFLLAGLLGQTTTVRPAASGTAPDAPADEAGAAFAGLIDEVVEETAEAGQAATAPVEVPLAPLPTGAAADDGVAATEEPPAPTGAPVAMTPALGEPTPVEAGPMVAGPLEAGPSQLESILSGWSGTSAGLAANVAPPSQATASAPMASPAAPAVPMASVPATAMPTTMLSGEAAALAVPTGDDAAADAAAPPVTWDAGGDPDRPVDGDAPATADETPEMRPATTAPAALAAPAEPLTGAESDAPAPAVPLREVPAPAVTAAAPAALGLAMPVRPAATADRSAVVAESRRAERGRDERALMRLLDFAAHGAAPAPSARLALPPRPVTPIAETAPGLEMRFDLGLARDVLPGALRADAAPHVPGAPRPPDHHAAAIGRQIADAAVTLGQDEIELALAPEELGKLRLRVGRGEGHGAVVTVWFERPEVLDTARRHLDQLMQDLRDSGLDGASLDLRGEGGHRPASQDARDGGGDAGPVPGDPVAGTGTPVLPQATAPARSLSDRQLDIRV